MNKTIESVLMILGIGSIGVPELLVVLVIGIFIFGAKKIPEIGSGLGKAIRSFNKGVKGEDEENKKDK